MPGYSVTTTNGELYHHGILGQKWGVKQGPPYPLKASAHSASEKKAGYRKSIDKKSRLERAAETNRRDAEDLRKHGYTKEADAVQKVANKQFAKAEKKKIAKENTRKAVKKYDDSYRKWEKMSEDSDKAWKDVRSAYKGLAKTPIGRIKEVQKAQIGKGSKAANKYLELWDKAEKMSNDTDEFWRNDTMKRYRETGKNRLQNILNTARYSTVDN